MARYPFAIRSDDLSPDGAPPAILRNLMPVEMPAELRGYYPAAYALAGTPGTSVFATLPTGPIRGMLHAPGAGSDRLYVAAGARAYAVTSGGVATEIGTIAGTDRAVMTSVRGDIIFTADRKAYRATLSAFSQLTDADIGTPDRVAAVGLRALFGATDSDVVKWSEPLEPGVISGLSFGTGERMSDRLVALLASSDRVALLQERSLEFWAQTGDPDEAFAPIPSAASEVGAVAGHAAVAHLGAIYFLDNNYVPRRLENFNAIDIGAPGLNRLLSKPANRALAASAIGWASARDGVDLYTLTVPGLGTWQHVSNTGTWIERVYGSTPGAYPVGWATSMAGATLLGRYDNAQILTSDSDTFTDAGAPIERLAYASIPVAATTRIRSLRIEGRALNVPVGVQPVALVALSYDNGQTWTAERSVPVHMPGQVRDASWLWGIARAPGLIVRVRIVSNYRVTLFGVSINEEIGAPAADG